MRIEKRKVFRALGESVVEKMFIDEGADTPEGWSDTPQDAMDAFCEPTQEAKPRRGRPRKDQ